MRFPLKWMFWLALAAAAGGCEVPFEFQPGAVDAATAPDSGESSLDAANTDAARLEDAGAAMDAAELLPDAAGLPDAGPQPDAATPAADAGTSPDAGADAGAGSDAGARRYSPAGSPWYQRVDQEPLAADSDRAIASLVAAGGWGNGNLFEIDFGHVPLDADDSTPTRNFNPAAGYFSPDCDNVSSLPLPATGAVEGETGYSCTGGGSCHLLVAHWPSATLYELFGADLRGAVVTAQCLVRWDMNRLYPETLRGENCTSADGAGLPITPLLFTAQEVLDGQIAHALRFRLPATHVGRAAYVRPATHSALSETGGPDAPVRGARLRLKASFDPSALPSNGARVVARALQQYGMILTDLNEVPLSAASDRFSAAKWSGLLGPLDLASLQVTDFERVETGPAIPYTAACVRNP